MTVKKKLDAIMHVQDYEVEISNKLKKIIKDTYDSYITCVNDFSVEDEYIEVTYDYICRGYGDTDYVSIPRKWLNEGFDYEAAYKEMKRREHEVEQKTFEAEQKRKAAAKKATEARKAKKEYETYLKLKRKYESKQPELHITSVWMDEESRKKIPPPKVYDENGKRIV